ncbi:DUF3606 domain-containing protein [Caenimonas soli]|uniref:DUF3606 domain-containing protein n=1 Tax=Caenimonas soli TaxID=2735555 RepID=UPI0038B34107
MRTWAASMGTTVERLEKAVNAVGISPRKVRSYLRAYSEMPAVVPRYRSSTAISAALGAPLPVITE